MFADGCVIDRATAPLDLLHDLDRLSGAGALLAMLPNACMHAPSCVLLRAGQHLDAGTCAQPPRHRARQVPRHRGRTPRLHHCTPSANECNFPTYGVLAHASDPTRVATWSR